MEVPVRRVSPAAERFPLPSYATAGAAGLDLRACLEEPVTLVPGERRLIPTGIAIALPSPQLVALVFARSGLASRHGIQLANGVGVIDSDYRGEILCAMYNAGSEPFVIQPGDRIAQLVVMPVARIAWREVDDLEPSDRGTGGFGSTGT
ncbi:MAG: deoxyuridine 5'-triphosphate nucleotidohydrolase [Firmicutes bacterium ZCTH02-B6]|nr:MAG: deoxyuridine 5'-triphosphate nucleotidohydrolase [Firmicutes bacterium ZCTH02-B6]